jgi:hypothetical protein
MEENIKKELKRINERINMINININKKEDDFQNIINEKDKNIQDIKDKLINQENEINIIKKKYERMVNFFIDIFEKHNSNIYDIYSKLINHNYLINLNKEEMIYKIEKDIKDEINKSEEYIKQYISDIIKDYDSLLQKIDERRRKNLDFCLNTLFSYEEEEKNICKYIFNTMKEIEENIIMSDYEKKKRDKYFQMEIEAAKNNLGNLYYKRFEISNERKGLFKEEIKQQKENSIQMEQKEDLENLQKKNYQKRIKEEEEKLKKNEYIENQRKRKYNYEEKQIEEKCKRDLEEKKIQNNEIQELEKIKQNRETLLVE